MRASAASASPISRASGALSLIAATWRGPSARTRSTISIPSAAPIEPTPIRAIRSRYPVPETTPTSPQ